MLLVVTVQKVLELKNVNIVGLVTRPDSVLTSEPVGLLRVHALRQLSSD